MIKKTSMTLTNNNFKKIAFVATAIVMLSVVGTFGFSDNNTAFAKKPQAVIDWSNGFPSGEHSTMNIHGKKAGYNCDNSLEGTELYGNSVFVQMYGTSEINIVSNNRSDLTQGKAVDPCAAPFGVTGNIDPALYQLPTGEHQVYWTIKGKPNNGIGNDGSSEARITSPALIDQCNFLPVAYEDGTIVQPFDPDAGLDLIAFNGDEKYVDANTSGDFDAGDSIYRDAGIVDKVDGADTLLYGSAVLADGTVDLVAFDGNERHEENTGSIANQFDGLETVYYSIDAVVSDGDIRLANASSQGLPEDQGGDAVNCEDQTLVGLGLVNNQGAFEKTEEGLKRFEDDSAKGKGKSKAIQITDLFLWTGSICDAAILDTWDTDGDLSLTINDFETGVVDNQITPAELAFRLGISEANALIIIDAAEDAVIAEPNDDVVDNGVIDTDAEFAAFLEIQFGTEFNCEAFYDEWVFNVADIVLYGFDYENNGTTLSQIRFYPTATTEFVE
jgi:hypothetical protein